MVSCLAVQFDSLVFSLGKNQVPEWSQINYFFKCHFAVSMKTSSLLVFKKKKYVSISISAPRGSIM